MRTSKPRNKRVAKISCNKVYNSRFVFFPAAEAGGRVFGSMGGGLDSDEVSFFIELYFPHLVKERDAVL